MTQHPVPSPAGVPDFLPDTAGVSLPRRWSRHADPDRGVLFAAVSGPGRGGTRASVLLAVRDGPVGTHAVPGCTQAVVEENDVLDLGGRPVGFLRTSAVVCSSAVVVEEWCWERPSMRSLVLRCTVGQEEYDALAPVFAALAARVDPDRPDAGCPGWG